MRDSQSLLDQLLAATAGKLTLEGVYAVLGTTGDERVTELAAAILKHDPKTALELITGWVDQGLQVGELIEQITGYWRSLMLVSCGGPDVQELPVSPTQKQAILSQVKLVSLDAILAGLEVWTATKTRLRDATHAQVLLEMAVVRLARLENLLPLGQLVQALSQGSVGSAQGVAGAMRQAIAVPEADPGAKKNGQLTVKHEPNGQQTGIELSTLPLTESTVPEVWARLIRYLSEKSPILANHLKLAIQPAIFGPNALAIRFSAAYNHAHEACATEGNTLRIQDGLQKLTGQPVTVRMEMVSGSAVGNATSTETTPAANPATERRKRLMSLPLFQKASEALGAQIWHVDDEFNPTAPPKAVEVEPEDDPDEI